MGEDARLQTATALGWSKETPETTTYREMNNVGAGGA